MKKFLNTIIGLVIGAVVLAPSAAIADTCVFYDPITNVCALWAPANPPAGWWFCGTDTNAYPGEFLAFTGDNHTGTCIGTNAGSTNFPGLGTYNDTIRSVKNNIGHTVRLYLHANYGGYSTDVWHNNQINLPTAIRGQVSSARNSGF